MFNLKNENIIDKFNNALEIVAKHYKLEISKCHVEKSGYKYNFITVPNGLVDNDDVHTYKEYQDKLLQIQTGDYRYLAPFYQVWMGEVDAEYLKHITKGTFAEINDIMKKIGKEKLITNKRN